MEKTEKELFEMANDIDFSLACMDAEDGREPMRKYSLQTIGDRIRLIKCLEAKGFKITKEK